MSAYHLQTAHSKLFGKSLQNKETDLQPKEKGSANIENVLVSEE